MSIDKTLKDIDELIKEITDLLENETDLLLFKRELEKICVSIKVTKELTERLKGEKNEI